MNTQPATVVQPHSWWHTHLKPSLRPCQQWHRPGFTHLEDEDQIGTTWVSVVSPRPFHAQLQGLIPSPEVHPMTNKESNTAQSFHQPILWSITQGLSLKNKGINSPFMSSHCVLAPILACYYQPGWEQRDRPPHSTHTTPQHLGLEHLERGIIPP